MLQLRSRSGMTNRCCDCDCNRHEGEIAIGDDESGSRKINFGVRQERSVLGGSVLGCNDLAGGAIGVTNKLGLGFSGFVGVGFWVSWSSVSSLSLSLCARACLPLTQLSLCFPENGYLKVK